MLILATQTYWYTVFVAVAVTKELYADTLLIFSFEGCKQNVLKLALTSVFETFFSTFFPQDDNDVYILTKVADVLHSIFSSYKEKVLPWFEQLLPLIVNLIVS